MISTTRAVIQAAVAVGQLALAFGSLTDIYNMWIPIACLNAAAGGFVIMLTFNDWNHTDQSEL